MPCRCGGTDHMRTTSRKCPLYKKPESGSSESSGSGSSESESESERFDVNGPAPEGYAQLASDKDESSEWEGPAITCTKLRSTRKRRKVNRFEARPASKARKSAPKPAPKSAPKRKKPTPKHAAKSKASKRKTPRFHLPKLPSFADKYPALSAQTQNVTPSLRDDIYDATQDHVLCLMDIDNHVDHCLTVARNFINVVRDTRSDNGLDDLTDTTCEGIMDYVATKARAAYMSSQQCPDPAPIAEKMPPPHANPNMTCKQIFQAAYDSTKTEEFYQAIRSVVSEAEALIYAIKRWHEDHVSAPVHEFLLGYARILYSRHVVEMNIDL